MILLFSFAPVSIYYNVLLIFFPPPTFSGFVPIQKTELVVMEWRKLKVIRFLKEWTGDTSGTHIYICIYTPFIENIEVMTARISCTVMARIILFTFSLILKRTYWQSRCSGCAGIRISHQIFTVVRSLRNVQIAWDGSSSNTVFLHMTIHTVRMWLSSSSHFLWCGKLHLSFQCGRQ